MTERSKAPTMQEMDELTLLALKIVELHGEEYGPVLTRMMDERDKMHSDANRRAKLRVLRRRLGQTERIKEEPPIAAGN